MRPKLTTDEHWHGNNTYEEIYSNIGHLKSWSLFSVRPYSVLVSCQCLSQCQSWSQGTKADAPYIIFVSQSTEINHDKFRNGSRIHDVQHIWPDSCGMSFCSVCGYSCTQLRNTRVRGPIMYVCIGGCINYPICYQCVNNNGVSGHHRRTHNLVEFAWKYTPVVLPKQINKNPGQIKIAKK